MAVVGEPELFIATPDRGTSVFGSADYCGPTGTGMLCEYRYEVISVRMRQTDPPRPAPGV